MVRGSLWPFRSEREIAAFYEVSDKTRREPNAGLYEWDGKTWFLSGHVHSDTCGHTRTDTGWLEPSSD